MAGVGRTLNMSTDTQVLVNRLHQVLGHLSQTPYPHTPNPEGCPKRASVAVIIRIRPPFRPVTTSGGSIVNLDAPESPVTSLNHFFSKQWVQQGDPEVLFIKRAGRAGDRWSGHVALPGGRRDPGDEDDMAAAIRETREEIGLDLASTECLKVGNLPERVVTTMYGKTGLMVLCPFLFLLTGKTTPTLQPQPTEVAAIHWVPLRALLSPSLRSRELVDTSSRMARQGGPVLRILLRTLLGRMVFSAVKLAPSESLYASSIPGFLPEPGSKDQLFTGLAQGSFGVPGSTQGLTHEQPLSLWGLTLGVMADFLDMLPPYNAVKLWNYPTYTTPDLRFFIYIFTRSLRQNSAGHVSTGSWPNQTAMDATTEAVAVSEAEPTSLRSKQVGIGGLGVGKDPTHAIGKFLNGYYERLSMAIGFFLFYRAILGSTLIWYLYKTWHRRTGRL